MKKLVHRSLIVFAAFFMMLNANAAIQFTITEGSSNAKPIGVVPFQWVGAGSAPENIAGVISSDLRNSGVFNPLANKDLPQTPYTASDVATKEWLALGVDAVVVGKIEPSTNGNYLISYQLVDTVINPGAVLSENQYQVPGKDLRYGAHKISDVIFERLTGMKGAFSTQIAYIAIIPMSGNKNIYELRIADYDGFNERLLHRSNQPLMSPAWSADARKVAFVTFESGRSELVMKDLANGRIEKIASYKGHNGAPAFSPDGTKLAFASSRDGTLNLYVMDLATRAVTQVTKTRSNDTEPSWFPDSNKILYTSDQAGRPQLFTLSLTDPTPQRLTWDGSQNQNGKVSADGKFVIMVSTVNGVQQLTKYDIERDFYMQLSNTFLDEAPSIAPNSGMIIYNSTKGYSTILNLVSADDNFKAELPTNEGSVKYPAWSPFR